MFKGILQNQFLQKWSGRINVEEEFSSSKIFKCVQEFEEYEDLLPEYLNYYWTLDHKHLSTDYSLKCF